MKNLNLLHERNNKTIQGFNNVIFDFKELKSEVVKSLITEVIKEDTGVDISGIETNDYSSSIRMDLEVHDLSRYEGQYLFGKHYSDFDIRFEVNMSTFNSCNYHSSPDRYVYQPNSIEDRIKALQLTPYLTKEYQEELGVIANSVHLGEEEDFALLTESKKWELEKENSKISSAIAEVKSLEIIETLLNNDLEINAQMRWGNGNYSYEYAETFRIDKVNDKSIKCSFIKSRGLTEPRVVTKNLKKSAFFDMIWSFVRANKTTKELIENDEEL